MRRRIYLDCDGVLADFDRGAEAVLGMPPRAFEKRYGLGLFWKRLAQADGFFEKLPLMADAYDLYEAVRRRNPVILTGLPRGRWAETQKRRWAALRFPGVPVITTMAALKREHCHPGDVLVDDRDRHAHLWEAAGGVFVHHKDARSSIAKLRALGYLEPVGIRPAGGPPRPRDHQKTLRTTWTMRPDHSSTSRASSPTRTHSKPGGASGRS